MQRALLALLVLGFAGCGTGGLGETESSANGEQLFQEKCGGCHTLAAAGTRGTIGPNLDDAFAAARDEGFEQGAIREVVLGQMRFPVPPMPEPEEPQMFPAGKYSDEERDDAMDAIASFVAEVAAKPGAAAGTGTGGTAAGTNDPKQLFASQCASCHTFAATGATGTVGPNLDQSQRDEAGIEQQIRHGGGGMPPFEGQLTDAQITALAKFVFENKK